MPDHRQIRTIAGRFDVEHERHPDPLRRWRSFMIWTAAGVGLLFVFYPLVSGDHRSVQSRPVTTAHQMFAQDCRACHDRTGQPAARLVTGNHLYRSVSDASCQKCHNQRKDDHHPESMIKEDVRNCVQCHQEHRGKNTLRRVANPHCVKCHTSLKTRDGPSQNFMSLNSFTDHPEFAGRRFEVGRVGKAHLLLERAKIISSGTGQANVKDATTLKFNHRYHLNPDGVMAAPGVPADDQGRVKLSCADCHQADEHGQYMKPISFESHCKKCHQLKLSDKFQWVDGKKGAEFPHGDPEIIRGILRDRLTSFAKANPDKLTSNPSLDRSRLPHKRSTSSDGKKANPEQSNDRKWSWVEQQLANIGEDVFTRQNQPGPVSASRLLATSCQHCHNVRRTKSKDTTLSWQIAPTKIPSRWYPHSRFNHKRHLMLKCVDCHYKKVPPRGITEPWSTADLSRWYQKDFTGNQRLNESIYGSRSSGDILMPSIATCRNCHGNQSRVKQSGQARSDCMECHTYHRRPQLRPLTVLPNRQVHSRDLKGFLK